MSARSEARGGDAAYRDPTSPLKVGDRVRTHSGVGHVMHIAYSHALRDAVCTVAIDTRIRLRLAARDLQRID
ncbi:MAG: hypothetical protein IT516_12305 [Burkholderiales bacterium]|nr:hypothetical protein [Burkholderiales bacterium]